MDTPLPVQLGADRCDVEHPNRPDLLCQLPTGHGDQHWHLAGDEEFWWAPEELTLTTW